MNPSKLQHEVEAGLETLLTQSEENAEHLLDCLSQMNYDTLIQPLKERQDLTEEEIQNLIEQIQKASFRFLGEVRTLQQKLKQMLRQFGISLKPTCVIWIKSPLLVTFSAN